METRDTLSKELNSILKNDVEQTFEDTSVLLDLGVTSITFLELLVKMEILFSIEYEDDFLILDEEKTFGCLLTQTDLLIKKL